MEFAPETYSQDQLDELDRLTEKWVDDYERKPAKRDQPRTPDSRERQTLRMKYRHLQEVLLEWAARAATGSAIHTQAFMEVLEGAPNDRDELRNAFLLKAKPLLDTPEGSNALLPQLYSAMMSVSVRLRGTAAEVIGQVKTARRNDLPELVYEGFTVLLADLYAQGGRWLRRFTSGQTFR